MKKNDTHDKKVYDFLRRYDVHGPEDVREKLTNRQKRRLRKRVNKANNERWAYLLDVL